MSYLDYARTTWAQFQYKCKGFNDKQEADYLVKAWIGRDIEYMIYRANLKPDARPMNKYELKPLPNDPTPAQIARAETKGSKKVPYYAKRAMKMYREMEAKGLI